MAEVTEGKRFTTETQSSGAFDREAHAEVRNQIVLVLVPTSQSDSTELAEVVRLSSRRSPTSRPTPRTIDQGGKALLGKIHRAR